MAFTEDEKVKIRHHLGYLNVEAAQTFQLGIPAATQTQFIVEGAMNRILAEAEPLARKHLERLDAIEEQIMCNIDNVELLKADEVEFNPKAFNRLLDRYRFFQSALANTLGCYPNPYDQRFDGALGGGVNVPVR